MKRNLLFAVLAITGFLFGMASCQKAPELTLTGPTNFELSADGGSATINFTANRDWRVNSSDDWITISPSSGAASNGTIAVSVKCNANTTYDDRAATVTISMEGLSQSVTVKQSANPGVLVPKTSYDVSSVAQTVEVEIQKNINYTVEIEESCKSWIKKVGTKALTSEKIFFEIAENTNYDARKGTITIIPFTGPEQAIIINQGAKEGIILPQTQFGVLFGGGEIEVKVQSNVPFDVIPNEEWIHYIQTKALSNSTIVLSVDENMTYSSREGKVELVQQNGSIKQSVTVKQAGRIPATKFELNKTELQLRPNTTEALAVTIEPNNATDKVVTWTSSDTSIVTVDEAGCVTAIANGSVTITAKTREKTATCTLKVCSEAFVGHAVDLGVIIARTDGTTYNLKWADCNLGANTPEEFGNYYAWGETETKDDYSDTTYKWYNGGYYTVGTPPNTKVLVKIKKYCHLVQTQYWDGSGSPDNKLSLDPEDDAVQVKLGGAWRMPTYEELEALIHQCSWTWTTKNGFHGYEVKSKSNGNTVFFPATGVKNLIYDGLIAGYFASSLSPEDPVCAGTLLIRSSGTSTTVVCYPTGFSRELGGSIRPVTE